MHIKNPFIKDYDFDALINEYPALKDFVFINQYGKQTIKFSERQSVKALNAALLKVHYNIYWDIPEHNLCPPIPGRLDYLLHLSDLINKKNVKLLDIGTGANLIYPILATSHFNWHCTGSEVDLEAIKNAQQLISNNPILSQIELRHQKYKANVLEHIIQPDDTFDLIICNPPFFKNSLDAQQNNQRKFNNLNLKAKDSLNFGGRSNELWYKGGEEAFVKKMASESVQFKNQVHWFTALVSKKENIKNIKRTINKTFPTEVKVVDMSQGHKISRFIAWTYR